MKPIQSLSIDKLTQLGYTKEQVLKVLEDIGISIESNGQLSLDKEEQKKLMDGLRSVRKQASLGSDEGERTKLRLGKKLSISSKKKSDQSEIDQVLNTKPNTIVSLDKKFTKTAASNTTKASAKEHTNIERKSKEAKKTKAEIEVSKEQPMTVEQVLAARKAQSHQKEEKTPLTEKSSEKSGVLGKAQNDIKPVYLPQSLTVKALADKIHTKSITVIKTLFDMGEMVTENQKISFETAEIILTELGLEAKKEEKLSDTNASLSTDFTAKPYRGEEDIRPRAPIVTIMGHVDHGKTSLLDKIRKANLADKEAGGITQHIGAWQVSTKHGPITFLDTPGHESFSAMRSRGAQITDLVILVVAADDGVMPQTIEAITHAKNAGVPIIVAINKIDKENADIEKLQTALSQHGVISESWGGEHIFQQVSAKTGQGIIELLDSIALQAEILDLKADYGARPTGVIIESRLDKGKGPVSTVIVKSGQFKVGQPLIVNEFHGKVRSMINSDGKVIKNAEPSLPFEITGISGAPKPGYIIEVVTSDKEAKKLSMIKQEVNKTEQMERSQALKTENFLKTMGTGKDSQEMVVLPIILKTDVDGSLEAIADYIKQTNRQEKERPFNIQVVSQAIGGINSSDVHLATASNSIIIGFNVRPDAGAKELINKNPVKIKYFSIIYELIEYLERLEEDMTEPETKDEITGEALVKDVFRASKFGTIAGCEVISGLIKKNSLARVLRDNTVIFSGKIESLRRFQDNVDVIKSGLECGIGIKAYSDIKPNDIIETYVIHEKKPTVI